MLDNKPKVGDHCFLKSNNFLIEISFFLCILATINNLGTIWSLKITLKKRRSEFSSKKISDGINFNSKEPIRLNTDCMKERLSFTLEQILGTINCKYNEISKPFCFVQWGPWDNEECWSPDVQRDAHTKKIKTECVA